VRSIAIEDMWFSRAWYLLANDLYRRFNDQGYIGCWFHVVARYEEIPGGRVSVKFILFCGRGRTLSYPHQ